MPRGASPHPTQDGAATGLSRHTLSRFRHALVAKRLSPRTAVSHLQRTRDSAKGRPMSAASPAPPRPAAGQAAIPSSPSPARRSAGTRDGSRAWRSPEPKKTYDAVIVGVPAGTGWRRPITLARTTASPMSRSSREGLAGRRQYRSATPPSSARTICRIPVPRSMKRRRSLYEDAEPRT